MSNKVFFTVAVNNETDDSFYGLLRENRNHSGLVFCRHRTELMDAVNDLKKHGFNAFPYHAGLDAETREINLRRFHIEGNVVLVAMHAFNKEIVKPDIRFVAHLSLPRSLSDYWVLNCIQ
jgi:ATP-dependent DNA helicase RecQ